MQHDLELALSRDAAHADVVILSNKHKNGWPMT
jgi:hypothetical protein